MKINNLLKYLVLFLSFAIYSSAQIKDTLQAMRWQFLKDLMIENMDTVGIADDAIYKLSEAEIGSQGKNWIVEAGVAPSKKEIRIKITGDATPEERSLIKNTVFLLNDLMETRKIIFDENDPNIVFHIDKQFQMGETFSGEIVIPLIEPFFGNRITKIIFKFRDEEVLKEKIVTVLIKLIAPYKINSLIFPESVFQGNRQKYLSVQEIDKFVIKEIYAQDFIKRAEENSLRIIERDRLQKRDMLSELGLTLLRVFAVISLLVANTAFYRFVVRKKSSTKIKFLFYNLKSLIDSAIFMSAYFLFFNFSFLNSQSSFFSDFIGEEIPRKMTFYLIIMWGFFYQFAAILLFFIDIYFERKIRGFFMSAALNFTATIVVFVFSFVLTSNLFIAETLSFNDSYFYFFGFTAIIAIYRMIILLFNKVVQNAVEKKDLELAQLKEISSRAELKALHSRINPHFLYNALNSIASLSRFDSGKTEKMALSLSKLFRHSLNKENNLHSTIAEEIDIVETYLEIEKTRFEERLDFQIEVENELNSFIVPKFLIQPIVENAVKHGISKLEEGGKLKINIFQDEKFVNIKICDNGPQFPEQLVAGYGLHSVQEKLEMLYKNNYVFQLSNEKEKHVLIRIIKDLRLA